MAEGIRSVFAVDLTRKWRALAERRKAHLVDLYDSGRWRLYYSEQEFLQRLREAIGAIEKWSATEQSAAGGPGALSVGPLEAANGFLAEPEPGAVAPYECERSDDTGEGMTSADARARERIVA